MTKFIDTPHGSRIAYNQIIGKKNGIVFLSGFGSDMQGKKALFIENWAKNNNHSFLRFDSVSYTHLTLPTNREV